MTAGLRDTIAAARLYSPADEQLNRRRRTAGLVLGPLAFLVMLAVPLPALTAPAHGLVLDLVALLVIAGVVMLLGGEVV